MTVTKNDYPIPVAPAPEGRPGIGYALSPNGEVVEIVDFYREHDPVYVPGFGPDDPVQQSLTRQEFKDECDINVIMKQYEGAWPPPPPPGSAVYMDFSWMPKDLQGALEFAKSAEAEFMKLPAEVRREFDNNAVAFCDFASNPANLEQMRDWGLAPRPPAAAPPPAPASSEPAPKA